MSQQVTVRLPEELVAFIDAQVHDGRATSRAAVVAAAVERERRRDLAERDVAILTAADGDEDGFEELARYAAGVGVVEFD